MGLPLDPTVAKLARAARGAKVHRLVCACCRGDVVLDGPHPVGRMVCTRCGARGDGYEWLRRKDGEHG